tara:strand:- start:1718 stop:1999 length:282 start_codon:yes stop_codon:yes gene_type:complete
MINQTIIGLVVGIIAPFIAFSVFVLFYLELDLFVTINEISKTDKLPHIISLSLLINLVIFFMKIKTRRDKAAQGVLGATILYAFIVIYLKFLL